MGGSSSTKMDLNHGWSQPKSNLKRRIISLRHKNECLIAWLYSSLKGNRQIQTKGRFASDKCKCVTEGRRVDYRAGRNTWQPCESQWFGNLPNLCCVNNIQTLFAAFAKNEQDKKTKNQTTYQVIEVPACRWFTGRHRVVFPGLFAVFGSSTQGNWPASHRA